MATAQVFNLCLSAAVSVTLLLSLSLCLCLSHALTLCPLGCIQGALSLTAPQRLVGRSRCTTWMSSRTSSRAGPRPGGLEARQIYLGRRHSSSESG